MEAAMTVIGSEQKNRMRKAMSFERLGTGFAAFFGVLALVCSLAARAQAPAVVQLPIGYAAAGIVPGGSLTACTSGITPIKNTVFTSFDGCPATQTSLNGPTGVAVDALGNIYIADYTNREVRVAYYGGKLLHDAIIAANPFVAGLDPRPGNVYSLAGGYSATLTKTGSIYYCNGSSGVTSINSDSSGIGCPANESYIQPRGIAVDKDGNVFFTTTSPAQMVRVVIVNPGTASNPTAAAKLVTGLYAANSVPLSGAPNAGFIYGVTGFSTSQYSGDGGPALAGHIYGVRDVAVDSNDNVYVTDNTANNIRVVYNSGNVAGLSVSNPKPGYVYTLTGNNTTCGPTPGTCASGSGGDNGPAAAAALSAPYTIFFDSNNNLYIADSVNDRLRVIYNSGTVPGLPNPVQGNIYTVAGGGAGTASGTLATQVSFGALQSAGIDQQGNLYLDDPTSKSIWRIDAKTAIATQIIGVGTTGTAPAAGASCNGGGNGPTSLDKQGDGCPGLQSAVSSALLIAFDAANNLYVVETSNSDVRRFSMNTQFAATPAASSVTQPLAFQMLSVQTPTSETFTLQGGNTTEFSDAGGATCPVGQAQAANTICTVNIAFAPVAAGARLGSFQWQTDSANSPLLLLAGVGQAGMESADPGSQLTIGTGLAPSGVATDLQGNFYIADSAKGQVVKAPISGGTSSVVFTGLSSPAQIAVDGAGNIYVADAGNNRIAELPAGGSSVVSLGSGLNAPKGLAVDSFGNLYVADTQNNRVVKILPGGIQQVLSVSGLSGPTGLALDASGELLVADTGNSRVVELAANGTQSALNLGSGTVTPQGLAVDAAGNLYIADSASLQVLVYPAGSAMSNVLMTGLQAPAGLAIDQNGSVYVADTRVTGALSVNRSQAWITFPITNVNQTTTAPLLISNTGNAPFSFNGSQLATLSGASAAPFSVVPGAASPCALATLITPSTQCELAANFLPTQRGTFSATASLLTSAANNPTVGALLGGTGYQLISTAASVSVSSPKGTIVYAQSVTITGTVTPQANGSAMTGTLTLTVDGQAQIAQPIGNGSISQILNLGSGIHVVSLGYSGDSNYASSSASTSFTINPAATTTTLTASPSSLPSGGPQITFQAAVSSPTASGLAGTVSFYAGTTLLSTVAVNAQGTATYTTGTVTYPAYSFTAVYNGSANFTSSTSAVVQPSGDFLLFASNSKAATGQGGVASLAITVTPMFNLNATLTPSCSNLPANAVCRFQPTSLQVSGTAPQTISILLYTNTDSNLAQEQTPLVPGRGLRSPAMLAGLFPGLVLLLSYRKHLKKWTGVIVLLFMACGIFGMSGCTAGAISGTTPGGSYNITVTLSGPNNLTHSSNYSFTVDSN
jgi:sugar lactone lactonase YvrE